MDALTFLAAVQEARNTLLGAHVQSVQAAGPHGLWFELTTPDGLEFLLVSADDVFPRLSRGAAQPTRARGTSATPLIAEARRALTGTSLQTLTHRGLDRLVVLEFTSSARAPGTGCSLVAELFGRKPNLVLVDRMAGQILEATQHFQGVGGRTLAPGHPYMSPPAPTRPDPRVLGTVEAIAGVLAPHLAAGMATPLALRQGFTGLTSLWEHELAARADAGTPQAVAQAVIGLIHLVENGPWEPRLVLDAVGRPIATSPIRLRHIPEGSQQPCASLGEMADRLASHLHAEHTFTSRQTVLRQALRRVEVRLRSRRAKLAAESLEFSRADLWLRMGEILVASQHQVPRGATVATLPDHAEGHEATLTIPLDPALSPSANADRLFKAARRGRRGSRRVAARLAETEAELGRVQAWNHRVIEAPNLESLEAVRREMEQIPRLLGSHDRTVLAEAPHTRGRHIGSRPSSKRRKEGPEPRRFISSDGLPILVGRDNEGNDYLTVHLAKSHDLWLHVQGHAGSHVLVQAMNREGAVPRRTLIQAAQLAAYYSQARTHGKVAVDYTLRKYVHKPRKTKPGLVTISHEKTVIVSPDKSLIQKLAAPEG